MRLLVHGAAEVVCVGAGRQLVKLKEDMKEVHVLRPHEGKGLSIAVDE